MITLVDDIRVGARSLAKSPGFTLVVVATLAFGIGLTTALSSLVEQLLLWSIPAREAPAATTLMPASGPPGRRAWKSATRNTSAAATSKSSGLVPLPDE